MQVKKRGQRPGGANGPGEVGQLGNILMMTSEGIPPQGQKGRFVALLKKNIIVELEYGSDK